MIKIRIKHMMWGIGTKLYELSGGYEWVIDFNSYGKMKVLSKECEIIKDEQSVDLDIVNSTIQSITNYIQQNSNEVSKNEIIKNLNIDIGLFELLVPKILRIDGFKKINVSHDLDSYSIRFIPPVPAFQINCKKMLEAFRLGVAPGFAVIDITIGRENELKIINNWQKDDFGSLMLIGQYGQGKSHMIRYIREKALREGYVVATCDIGKESQMSKPRTVLNTLMRTLTFRIAGDDESVSNSIEYNISDLLYLYADYMSQQNNNYLENNIHFRRITSSLIYKVRNKIPLDNFEFVEFIDYLHGDETIRKFERIPNFATSANIVCNILSAIGNMAFSTKNKTGLKGLMIIFDEGEDINNPIHQKSQRISGKNFLLGITKIANNDKELFEESMEDELKRNSEGKWKGIRSGLTYSGIKKIKFSDYEHSHVKCLFAFVEGEDKVIDELESEHTEKIELSEFSEHEKKLLIKKITDIHQKCYDYKIDDFGKLEKIIINRLTGGGNTRSAIKTTTEALDLIHSHPGIDYDIILRERNT